MSNVRRHEESPMLLPTLTNWRSQFERLKRSYARVTGAYQSSIEFDDDLHHFMQDCWHLKDWIRNDPSAGIGAAIEAHAGSYRSLRIAADLANGSKHLLRHTHREGAHATSIGVTTHLGQSKPIEVECTVTLGNGTTMPVFTVVHEAFADWHELLAKIGLNP
jgi:hypothetical protein